MDSTRPRHAVAIVLRQQPIQCRAAIASTISRGFLHVLEKASPPSAHPSVKIYAPMRTVRNTAAALILLLIPLSASAQSGTQSAMQLEKEITTTLGGDYLLYLPEGYEESTDEWPLLLFLHGAGERGDDLEMVKRHGPPKLIEEGKDFPFIVVSPQCPKNQGWDTEFLSTLLDEVLASHRVDESRVYLTGISMGGYGTWALGIEQPERFAAVAPICGGGAAYNACALKDTPVWVFHGALDFVVPIEESIQMVAALKRCDANVEFTVYPMAGHDSWTETYDNPALYEWMLSHRKEN